MLIVPVLCSKPSRLGAIKKRRCSGWDAWIVPLFCFRLSPHRALKTWKCFELDQYFFCLGFGHNAIIRICQESQCLPYAGFFLMGELRWSLSALPQWRKRKVERSQFFILSASRYFPFPSGKHWIEALPNSPYQNKGFLNYVFCRNWAVRNPAGTRLDSV